MKRLAARAALLMSATVLTACGGSDKSYCDTLEGVESLSAQDNLMQFKDAIAAFEEVENAAPDELEDDWEVLVDAVDDMYEALTDAGLDDEQISTLLQGQQPEGFDAAQLAEVGQKVQAAFGEIDQTEVADAATRIASDAQERCEISLATE